MSGPRIRLRLLVYILATTLLGWPASASAIPTVLPVLDGLFASGVDAEAWTVQGDAFWLKKFRLTTPRELDRIGPGEPVARLETSSPGRPPFANIQRIIFNGLTTTWMGSDPAAMECYGLGSVVNAVPPPPDWQRSIGQIPPWRHPARIVSSMNMPYLDRALFCWVDEGDTDGREAQVYLFRQAFELGEPLTAMRATLRVATNAEVIELAFNQHPLHMGHKERFKIAEFDVTPLLRAKQNIVAVQVREDPGKPNQNHGLAFHLEVVRPKPSVTPPRRDPRAALLMTEEGDRLWARLIELRGDRILAQTPYGAFNPTWEACTGVLLPTGWHPAMPEKGLFEKVLGRGEAHSTIAERWGLPLRMEPKELQDCLLLTQGRLTTAKPSYVVDDRLFFEGYEGKQYSLPMDEVLGIYPPRPSSIPLKRPDPQAAVLFCELTTTSGEQVGGLLRSVSGKRVVLNTIEGDQLVFKPRWVSEIYFPYHAEAGQWNNNGTVGLIAQASGQEASRPTYLADLRRVQAAVYSIRANESELPLETLADPSQLTPENVPVIISVDPLGEYLHTHEASGDAQAALVSYLEQGGILIALSRGGAFRSAVMNGEGRFQRTHAELLEPSLRELLQIEALRPTGAARADVTPFDHPPNRAGQIYFQRTGQLPQGLKGLPRRIHLSPMLSAPFYPMVPLQGQGQVIYTLSDDADVHYGPALSLVPKGRGTVVLIDHLLWESQPHGRPFTENVLPALLRWALETVGE